MVIFLTLMPATIVVWALLRWDKSAPRFEKPLWRSCTAFAAFCFSVASVLLWVFTAIWALARRGFPYYDPVLLRIYGFGALLGLIGFLVSLPGKGKLRWPACGVAALMTFLWLVA